MNRNRLQAMSISQQEAIGGINVIGHVSANLGLGVVARNVVRLAQSVGRAVTVYDVDAGGGRSGADRSFESCTADSLDALPHAINIFVVGLGNLDEVLRQCPARFFDGSRLNAILCFWELPTLPAWGVQVLERMDVVLAATDFMDATYRQYCCRALVIPARIPVTPPPATVPWDRQRHGVADDGIVFVCGFEPQSDTNRKNPFGVIEAFLRDVGHDHDAYLLVRINNAKTPQGILDGVVQKVSAAAGGHPRIKLLTEPMSYAEVVGMYRDAQVYVSLHRAEGLGLGMAEAMLMERPVIATGWSGNLSFMSHASSCLVSYRMIRVNSTLRAYSRRRGERAAVWADPRIDEAATLMRLLKNDAGLRGELGQGALAAMVAYNRNAANADFLVELDVLLARRAALGRLGFMAHGSTPSFAVGEIRPPSLLQRAWWRFNAAFRRG